MYCTINFNKMYTYMHVPECVECLFTVIIRRSYIGDHDGLSVASQRVLQESSQLGVTVRNVSAPSRHQSTDDVTECGEREINLGSFLEPVTLCTSLGLSL